jgi:serine/threonine-protein kinase
MVAAADSGERRRGRYTLLGEIASGGMATVHIGRLAGEGGFARMFAIKCMHKHLADDPEFRAMFLDEARLAARIQHPNVVATIDVGTSDEGMFLVTEYIAGESLAWLERAAAARGAKIEIGVALRIVADALSGLHAAHTATDEGGGPLSIVHRDVSPQNVLVGTDGLARVLDFGIAKAAGRSHTTRDGQLKGKLRYMAPEQFRDLDVSPATDVYAASVVLWELLTGQRLFAGTNDAAVMARVLEGVVAPPSKLAPHVSAELDAVVARGLAREPSARFSTAREMAEALERVGLATGRQVGEWVELVAGDALRARAAKISGTNAAPAPARAPDLATQTSTAQQASSSAETSTYAAQQTSTRLAPLAAPASSRPIDSTAILPASTRSVPPPPPMPAREPARSAPLWMFVMIAAALAVLTTFAVRAARGSHATKPPAEDTTVASVADSAAANAPASASPIAAPVASDPQNGAPIVAAPSASVSRPVSSGRNGGHPPSGKGPHKPNCSPPYYEDENGIRRVKPQCL